METAPVGQNEDNAPHHSRVEKEDAVMFNMMPYRANRGLFDDFANDFFKPLFNNAMMRPERAMKVDVRDDGDHYTLEADMPGVTRDDVKVEVTNGVLTLSAGYDESKEDKDAEDRYVYRERRCGSVSRSFNVEGIREEDITARFQDGVLTLELPKREAPAVPEARHIEIQ